MQSSKFAKNHPSNRRPSICSPPKNTVPAIPATTPPPIPALIGWHGHSFRPTQPNITATVNLIPTILKFQWAASAIVEPFRLKATLTLHPSKTLAILHFDLYFRIGSDETLDDEHNWQYHPLPKTPPESPSLEWIETHPPGRIFAKIAKPPIPI